MAFKPRRFTGAEFKLLPPDAQEGYRRYWGDSPADFKADSTIQARREQVLAAGERKATSDSLALAREPFRREADSLLVAQRRKALEKEPTGRAPTAFDQKIAALRRLNVPQTRIDSIVGGLDPAGSESQADLIKRLRLQIQIKEKQREAGSTGEGAFIPGLDTEIDSLYRTLSDEIAQAPGTERERAPLLRYGGPRGRFARPPLTRPETTKAPLDFMWGR